MVANHVGLSLGSTLLHFTNPEMEFLSPIYKCPYCSKDLITERQTSLAGQLNSAGRSCKWHISTATHSRIIWPQLENWAILKYQSYFLPLPASCPNLRKVKTSGAGPYRSRHSIKQTPNTPPWNLRPLSAFALSATSQKGLILARKLQPTNSLFCIQQTIHNLDSFSWNSSVLYQLWWSLFHAPVRRHVFTL